MRGIDIEEAVALLKTEGRDTYALLDRANAVRIENRGYEVRFCGVVNAKSGECNQDCKFCAQSGHNDADIDCYGLMDAPKIVAAAGKAAEGRAGRFGIVTSGLAINDDKEIGKITRSVVEISEKVGIFPCASLGKISRETMAKLKEAGLTRYHSNIETSKSYFPEICSTRDWEEAVETIRTAQDLGLKTCSGGIIGLGESIEQRAEFLSQVRDMNVDTVPLNFLNPIEGTKLTHLPPLTPLECLRVIAVARLMMPTKEIRVCGGREHNLKDLQSWLLLAGADGLMVGGYLTTSGRNIQDDIQMVKDAGFTLADPDA